MNLNKSSKLADYIEKNRVVVKMNNRCTCLMGATCAFAGFNLHRATTRAMGEAIGILEDAMYRSDRDIELDIDAHPDACDTFWPRGWDTGVFGAVNVADIAVRVLRGLEPLNSMWLIDGLIRRENREVVYAIARS